MPRSRLYILTGGPGAGKTTVLEELGRRGFGVLPEVARQIIREQVQSGGTALPWRNRELYARRMLQRSIDSYRASSRAFRRPGAVFCDRGIPDTLGYLRLSGLEEREAVAACSTCRYATQVFFAPPWEEIYAADSERRQDFAEAVRTPELLAEVYRECGYTVRELPPASPRDRADFLLQQLGVAARPA
jgi:predicted ATPase